ncbi:MAG: GNAT family N-acetyltransferase [Aristaeellaceae bacterium]
MIRIRTIDRARAADINIPNEPFALFGRMIPACADGKWTCSIRYDDTVSAMTFPDERYDYDALATHSTFLGAYDGETCIGLAVLQEGAFRYMYLYDLKVNAAYRRQGIAGQLIGRAEEIAREKGYIGLWTQGQDNNLGACLFYLHAGFDIGGFDNRVYDGTKQAGKADILFYKRFAAG